jgi:ABC-type glycerol-3-phosphate transport system substrate-binding protein
LGPFIAGRAAIQTGTTQARLLSALDENFGLPYETAFRPFVGPSPGTDVTMYNGHVIMLTSNSKNPIEAVQVMSAWIDPKNLKGFTIAHGGVVPVQRALLRDADILRLPLLNESMALLQWPMVIESMHPLFVGVRGRLASELERVFSGQLGVNAALLEAERVTNTMLKELLAAK